jgi:hypothetical protein
MTCQSAIVASGPSSPAPLLLPPYAASSSIAPVALSTITGVSK